MKTQVILVLIFVLLGIGLSYSTWYDYDVNRLEIANYRCEKTVFTPFPEEFEQENAAFADNQTNRFEDDKLYLSYLKLSSLPDDLFYSYPCIQKLDLNNNQFKEVPKTIRYLTGLEIFDISYNQITSLKPIAHFYEQFEDLEVFKVAYNQLDTLDFFPIADDLWALDFSYNNIHHVSKEAIPDKYDVRELRLNSNQLKSVPAELLSKLDVQSLFLDNNQISQIEGNLAYGRIKLLSLKNNVFKVFPTNLGFLDIRTLNMDGNPIEGKVILDGFNDLKELKLNSGKITSVEIESKSISRLERLDFSSNKINSFRSLAEIDRTSLQVLLLNNNELKTFPEEVFYFNSLNEINLAYNKIRNIAFDHLALQSKISTLDLFDNQLQSVTGIDSLRNLRVLYLGRNNLTKIPDGILDSYTLMKVDLRENAIRGRVEFTAPIMNELKLNGNKITSFHLKGATNLQTLDLSDNDLRTLGFEEGSLYEMKELNISNNPNLKYFPEEVLSEYSNIKIVRAINIGVDEKDMMIWKRKGSRRGMVVITKPEEEPIFENMSRAIRPD